MVRRVAVAGQLLVDALTFLSLGVRSRSRLAAENLFLRKQLALYAERRVKSRRATDATRITLVVLARLIDWKAALIIVKPATLIRRHRKGFELFWHAPRRAWERDQHPTADWTCSSSVRVCQVMAPTLSHARPRLPLCPRCRRRGERDELTALRHRRCPQANACANGRSAPFVGSAWTG